MATTTTTAAIGDNPEGTPPEPPSYPITSKQRKEIFTHGAMMSPIEETGRFSYLYYDHYIVILKRLERRVVTAFRVSITEVGGEGGETQHRLQVVGEASHGTVPSRIIRERLLSISPPVVLIPTAPSENDLKTAKDFLDQKASGTTPAAKTKKKKNKGLPTNTQIKPTTLPQEQDQGQGQEMIPEYWIRYWNGRSEEDVIREREYEEEMMRRHINRKKEKKEKLESLHSRDRFSRFDPATGLPTHFANGTKLTKAYQTRLTQKYPGVFRKKAN